MQFEVLEMVIKHYNKRNEQHWCLFFRAYKHTLCALYGPYNSATHTQNSTMNFFIYVMHVLCGLHGLNSSLAVI